MMIPMGVESHVGAFARKRIVNLISIVFSV